MEFAAKISLAPNSHHHGCSQPAGRDGGFVRLVRPMKFAHVCARAAACALGLAAMLHASPVQGAVQQTRKPVSTTKKATAKKTTYSASSSSARKARLARARSAARAREQARLRSLRTIQEAMTPRFKTDESGALVPDIRAAAAVIFDPMSGQVLWGVNAQDKRSIASITKVMTTVVFLEDQPDLTQVVTVERGDVYAASTTYLRANERLTLDNLLHLTLIASDNAAARALARLSHGGTASFVDRMNTKAIELGLENTSFTDPSGLRADNISSAYDLSKLITYAATDEKISPIVAPIMRMAEYKVATSRRSVTIKNTNRLVVDGDVDVMGGKTGFISKAGHCLATLLRLPQNNHPVAVVVLGAGSNTGRFWETRHLFNWLSQKATDLFKDRQDQPQE
jgi:serine-type D-Ala-D-Ala endopeptidase (penicillin-binding protein 7)